MRGNRRDPIVAANTNGITSGTKLGNSRDEEEHVDKDFIVAGCVMTACCGRCIFLKSKALMVAMACFVRSSSPLTKMPLINSTHRNLESKLYVRISNNRNFTPFLLHPLRSSFPFSLLFWCLRRATFLHLSMAPSGTHKQPAPVPKTGVYKVQEDGLQFQHYIPGPGESLPTTPQDGKEFLERFK